MLKLILYLGLTAVGLVAAFFSPLAGAIGVLGAYLLNPSALSIDQGVYPYQLWLTIAFMLGLAIHRPAVVPKVGGEGWILKALWIFLFLALASSAWAVVSAETALTGVYEVFKTILVATLLIRVIRGERDFRILMAACLIGVFHAGVLATIGIRFGYVDAGFARDYGILPDSEAAVFVLFLPTFWLLAIYGTWKERVFSWCALPFVLDGLVSSYQRASFVALAVQTVLLLFMLPARITLRLMPVLLAGAALFVFRLTPDNYWERMRTIVSPTEEASANSRFVIADASMRMFLDYPFGVGYANYGDLSPKYLADDYLTEGRRTEHNTFFAVLCETGILGFIAWIATFGGALFLLRRLRKNSDPRAPSRIGLYAMGLELGLYGWFVTGLFQSNHEVDPAYWFLTFTVILVRLNHVGKEVPPEAPAEVEFDSLRNMSPAS